jgi:hypothetical protein
MLQPSGRRTPIRNFAIRIWGGLTLSMFIYLFVIFQLGKVHGAWMPQGFGNPIEYTLFIAFLALVGSFILFKNKVQPQAEFSKKFPLLLACWGMNESAVIIGFFILYTGHSGNGLYLILTVLPALVLNIKMFPR